MKILLCITARNDKVLNISGSLKNMGHDVHVLNIGSYHSQCTYMAKKIDELGFHVGRDRYRRRWQSNFVQTLLDWKPKKCIFINTASYLLSESDWYYVRQKTTQDNIQFILWLVDPVSIHGEGVKWFKYFDKIFTYEKKDAESLADLNIKVAYLPVGYNWAYECNSLQENEKKWDVCFVGSPYKNRMVILNEVAKKGQELGWKIKIAGPFWSALYIWKKYIVKLKYPHMYKCVDNGELAIEKVALLYKQSKICLNIHVGGADALNPRTFDILATGALEIIDTRGYYDRIIPGKDLVTYENTDELIQQIKYYLENNDKREEIAQDGWQCAKKYYSMYRLLKELLE